MIQSEILRLITTEKCYGQCLSEYFDSIANNYVKATSIITQCIEWDPDVEVDLDIDAFMSLEDFNILCQEAQAEFNGDSLYPIQIHRKFWTLNGPGTGGRLDTYHKESTWERVRFYDLCKSLWYYSGDPIVGNNAGDCVIYPLVKILKPSFIPENYDTPIGYVRIEELLLSAVGSLESVSSIAAGLACFSHNNLSSVVDRVSYYKDAIGVRFNDASKAVSGSVSSIQSMVYQHNSIGSFIESLSAYIGVDTGAVADEDTDQVYNWSSDFESMTGASVAAAIQWDTIGGAISGTCKVACNVIKGVFNLAVKAGKWAFSKAAEYVEDTIIDPEVVKYIDDPTLSNAYFDGYFVQRRNRLGVYRSDFSFSAICPDFSRERVDAVINKYLNKWIKIEHAFGACCFKFTGFDTETGYPIFDYNFKPSMLSEAFDSGFAGTNGLAIPIGRQHSSESLFIANLNDTIKYCKYAVANSKGSFGPDKGSSKYDLARGLSRSVSNVLAINDMAGLELAYRIATDRGYDIDYSRMTPYTGPIYNPPVGNQENNIATNRAFLSALIGVDSSTGENINDVLVYSGDATDPELVTLVNAGTYDNIARSFIWLFLLSALDRDNNPWDYAFAPYSRDDVLLPMGKWSLKTDNEINDTANNFITGVVAVVLVLIAAVTVGCVVKKLSRKLFVSRSQKLATLQAKMWNGEKLTSRESKRFWRLSNKLNCATVFTSSMSGFSNSDSRLQQLEIELANLRSLVTGYAD